MKDNYETKKKGDEETTTTTKTKQINFLSLILAHLVYLKSFNKLIM